MFLNKRIITCSLVALCLAVSFVNCTEDYSEGGAEWTGTCATGTKQSPINIPLSGTSYTGTNYDATATTTADSDATFYGAENMTIMLASGPFSSVTVKDETTTFKVTTSNGLLSFKYPDQSTKLYTLVQFHIHSPSEHTFDGKHYDLEVHLVHQATDLTYGVVALFFDTSAGDYDNPFITSLAIATNTAAKKYSWTATAVPLQDQVLALDTSQIYYYQGSFTTSPCTEGVNWHLINSPLPISTSQLASFTSKWAGNTTFANGNGNNRNTQELNGRNVYYQVSSAVSQFSLTLAIFAFLAIFNY